MSRFKFNFQLIIFIYLFYFTNVAVSQSAFTNFFKPSDSLNIPRRNFVIATEGLVFAVGILQLNKIFETGNYNSGCSIVLDNSESLQIDKAVHAFTSYQIGNTFYNLFNWSGVSKKNKLIFGAGMGFAFLSTVEVIDGFSKNHDAAFGDIVANASGTSLFVFQDLLWKEQRIVPKISLHSNRFLSTNMKLIKSQVESDFNDETFWLSFNLHSFLRNSKIPKCLNIALGYGVEKVGVADTNPYSQVFLSLDIDFTKIETKSHLLKTLFSVFNCIKVPAPTIEFSRNSQLNGYFVYF
jgi:hypothetical protein